MLPESIYHHRYEEPKTETVDTCCMCDSDIVTGEEYYSFPDIVCKDCVNDILDSLKKKDKKRVAEATIRKNPFLL